jgi:hypothetical protein
MQRGKTYQERFNYLNVLFPQKVELQRYFGVMLRDYDAIAADANEGLKGKFGGTIDREAEKTTNSVSANLQKLSDQWVETKEELGKTLVSAGAMQGLEAINELLKQISDDFAALRTGGSWVYDKMLGPNTLFGKALLRLIR